VAKTKWNSPLQLSILLTLEGILIVVLLWKCLSFARQELTPKELKKQVKTLQKYANIVVNRNKYEKDLASLKDLLENKSHNYFQATHTEDGQQALLAISKKYLSDTSPNILITHEFKKPELLDDYLYLIQLSLEFSCESSIFPQLLYAIERHPIPIQISFLSLNNKHPHGFYGHMILTALVSTKSTK
jgi:hypothetical protein